MQDFVSVVFWVLGYIKKTAQKTAEKTAQKTAQKTARKISLRYCKDGALSHSFPGRTSISVRKAE